MAYLMLDIETTGLDPKGDRILEVSFDISDDLMRFDGVTPSFLIRHSFASVFGKPWDAIDPYVQNMHTESGLKDALLAENRKVWELGSVDDLIARLLDSWEGPHYLVGNSIRLDRAFIEAQMPKTAAKLHYRQIDVTAVRLFLEGIGVKLEEPPVDPGLTPHRAADDVRASIAQLQHYAREVRRVFEQHIRELAGPEGPF